LVPSRLGSLWLHDSFRATSGLGAHDQFIQDRLDSITPLRDILCSSSLTFASNCSPECHNSALDGNVDCVFEQDWILVEARLHGDRNAGVRNVRMRIAKEHVNDRPNEREKRDGRKDMP
jgi:hypothetical protein